METPRRGTKRKEPHTRDTERALHRKRRHASSQDRGADERIESDEQSPDGAGASVRPTHLHFGDDDDDDVPPPRRRKPDGGAPLLSAHAVGHIDKFFGGPHDDVENWIFSVESYAKLARLSEEAKVALAGNALKGAALSEFRSFAANDVEDLTWSIFVSFLRDRFGPRDPRQYWMRQVMSCKQGSREDVRTFSSRFRTALSSLRGLEPDALSDLMAVSRYREGLRKELRKELDRRPPKSLSKAVEKATMAESLHPIASKGEEEGVFVTSTASGSARSHPPTDIQTQLLQTLVQQQSQLLQQNSQILQQLTSSKPNPFSVPFPTSAPARVEIPESQAATRTSKFCSYCKKSGHIKDECFKLQRKREAEKGSSFPSTATASAPNETTVNLVFSSKSDGSFESPPASFTIGGLQPVRTLFDTGSKVSILSEEFASQFGCDFIPVKESYTAANNQPLEVLGAITLEFAAADFRINQRFLIVPEFSFSALLGRDFLRAAAVDLSFEDGTVTVGKPPNMVRIQTVPALSEEDGVSDGRIDLASSDNRVYAISVADRSPSIVLPSVDNADSGDHSSDGSGSRSTSTEPCSPPTLYRYVNVFSQYDGDLGRIDAGLHSVYAENNHSVNQPPRRLASPLFAEAERQISSMQQSGVIRNSSSPWVSPIFFTDTKDTSKQFCVRQNRQNRQTANDLSRLPVAAVLDHNSDSSKEGGGETSKLYYAHLKHVSFEPGSLVLLHSNVRKPGLSPKLRQHFDGPYRVQNRLNDSTYELVHVESGSATLANVQRIIRYYSPSTQLPPSTAIEVLPSGSTTSTSVHPSAEASLQLLPSVTTSSFEPVDSRDGVEPHALSTPGIEDQCGSKVSEVAPGINSSPHDDVRADSQSDHLSDTGSAALTADATMDQHRPHRQVRIPSRSPFIPRRSKRPNAGQRPSRFDDS